MRIPEKKIILIDDDPRNIFALSATLKAKGYVCKSFYDASSAIKELDTFSADIVLIDMMMPEMDGYEAIPKIKQVFGKASLPVIAVTAQAMEGDREKCLAAGADDYIVKPIDVDKLVSVLEKHIK